MNKKSVHACRYVAPSLPAETDDTVDQDQRSYYYIVATNSDGSLTGYDTYLSDRFGKDTYVGYDVEIHTPITLKNKEQLYEELRGVIPCIPLE